MRVHDNHILELRGEELNERGSSQLWTQLLQLRKESLKKFGLVVVRGSKPGPLRYQCSALPVKLTSQLRVIRMYKSSLKSAASSFSNSRKLLAAFITPFGKFQLPQGIYSTPEYYQKRMMQLLKRLHGV